MSDVTTSMKTFRAEWRLGIKYRLFRRRTGSYMACNHSRCLWFQWSVVIKYSVSDFRVAWLYGTWTV